MLNTQYGNYVKFIRGTEASWAKIADENKNSDTLYFISNTNSSAGKLYLGSKLISNGALSSATSLKDLNDVIVKAEITDQSILVYNTSEEKWENKSLLDIFETIQEIFKGADAENAGAAGLVPAPAAGEQDLFLRGDGSWANPVTSILTEVEGIQTQLSTILGEDKDKNLSIRDIAKDEASSSVANILAEAPEQFDTLKEIADWIQSNSGAVDVAGLTSRVVTLEEIIYGISADEEAGTEAIPGLQSVVSTLQDELNILTLAVDTNTTEIDDIKNILKWQDITEDETEE